MASIVLIGLTVLLVLYRIYKYMFYKPDNFPPGPPRIPVYGSYLFMLLINHKHLHKAVQVLCNYYKSKIIGLYIGPFPAVLANCKEGVHEILYRQEFDGRLDLYVARMRDPDFNRRGIFFTDGPFWKEQRRFMLRYLRDFGFGRRFDELEYSLNEELTYLVDLIRYGPKYDFEHSLIKNGKVLCPDIFFLTASNALIKIFCGEKLPREKLGLLLEASRQVMRFQRNGDDFGKLFSLTPWVAKVFPETSGYKEMKEGNDGIYQFMENIVREHFKKFDGSRQTFLDLYFAKIKESSDNETPSSFQIDQLVLGLVDFLFPAATGLPAQLSLLCQRLLLNPHVQMKIQEEIDEAVGSGRFPTLDDRQRLSYTDATIREAMRIDTLVPSNLPHRAMVDTTLLGYTIPKNCVMVTGLDAFHNDPDEWQDPRKFMPERFLDSRGRLSLKKDISLPFGAGKRLCAGETYARNAEFLMVSTLLQNFTIKIPDGEPLPDQKTNLTGLIISPKDYWIQFIPR